ncbi:iron-sulfur cluster carrier protein ApbC [Spirabiliibacterium falconis]|uniref:iron-sulfur cluster carrier protein ApbC n=1 Tax=Spirabiliibacterium falconis TaxID=572023 RepID=UPI001AACEA0F|nr:iron-sulfur cluster carrier protein ApbC [Spirabiliibacterium falconis]MBE2894711.1 iron-sulfur cluster carrier protein ApbC [Spirabiliibacterium falconis]
MAIMFSQTLADKKAEIEHLFAQFRDPTLQKTLLDLNAVKKVELADTILHIDITMPFAWNSGFARLKTALSDQLLSLTGAQSITWQLHHAIATLKRANAHPAVKGVKNIIAVTSGKGGVGKSSVAVNLALALKAQGARVGILDADIYGPSIPHMLGAADQRPTSPDNKHMVAIESHGIYANSIGFLMEADNATIWRGPMASSALSQLLQETLWADLDYLVIDMPPGTGDIQLTLSQQIPVTGAIVVTTPQDIALLDAIKGIAMFERVQVPVLGIIENMSVHICAKCGHQEAIFGTGGAEKVAEKYHINVLGKIPLHIRLREDLDRGEPTVIADSTSPITQDFMTLAQTVAAELYWQGSVIPTEIMFREVK